MNTFHIMLTLLDLDGDRGCSVQSGTDFWRFEKHPHAVYTEEFVSGQDQVLHIITDVRLTEPEVLITLEAWQETVIPKLND